jgi:hypothetical protein
MAQTPFQKFGTQRKHSRHRGIQFLFTFQEWMTIWEQSGRWHERGRGREEYCMARFGDTGPYAVGNVKIITNYENNIEVRRVHSFTGRKHSEVAKEKMSLPWRTRIPRTGWNHTEESKAKMCTAALKRRHSPETRAAISRSLLARRAAA